MNNQSKQARYDISEFINGQRDCRDGVAHQSKNDSYDAGYSAEYELQQIKDYRSMSDGLESPQRTVKN